VFIVLPCNFYRFFSSSSNHGAQRKWALLLGALNCDVCYSVCRLTTCNSNVLAAPRYYTQWSTECDKPCKQLADVVQQFAVRDESPPWSRHLEWVAPRRISRHDLRQDHVLSPCMVWSLLSIRPCKTAASALVSVTILYPPYQTF